MTRASLPLFLCLVACVTPPQASAPAGPAPAPSASARPDACFEGKRGVVLVRWVAQQGGGFALEDPSVSSPSLEPVARCFGEELAAAGAARDGKGDGRGTFRFSRDAAGFEALAALRFPATAAPEALDLLRSRGGAVRACGVPGGRVRVLVDTSGRFVDVTVPSLAGDDAVAACVTKALGDASVEGHRGPPVELEWDLAD